MKAIVVLVLCAANTLAGLSIDQQEGLRKFGEECSKEVDITMEKVQEALLGETEEDNDKLECFVDCLLHKRKIMDKDGNIDEKVLREEMPKDMPKKESDAIIEKCMNIDAESGCKKAAELAKCVIKSIAIQKLS